MFIDEIEFTLKGGHGGAGKVSFLPGLKSGPDGGDGGKGGSIYIQPTTDLTALKNFTNAKIIEAQRGEAGQSQRKFGRDGQDKTIRLPIGCELHDINTGEIFEITNQEVIKIVEGGKGGQGNYQFRSSTNTTPMYAQPGLLGQERHLKIILKLIADYGLIGLPNSGKTSLLNELTGATAKVGDYSFTTLEPNLGVLGGKILADIPGLIEGAHEGKGLGIKFLKHIEKVSTLLHCIAADSNDVVADYSIVRAELGEFNSELLDRKELILLTKSDLVNDKLLQAQVKKLKKLNANIRPISIHNWDEIEDLKKTIT